jgi:hypothetical protein
VICRLMTVDCADVESVSPWSEAWRALLVMLCACVALAVMTGMCVTGSLERRSPAREWSEIHDSGGPWQLIVDCRSTWAGRYYRARLRRLVGGTVAVDEEVTVVPWGAGWIQRVTWIHEKEVHISGRLSDPDKLLLRDWQDVHIRIDLR